VRLALAEAHNLLLDRRAVARPHGVRRARRDGRAKEVVADDAVRLRVGVHQVARQLGPPGGRAVVRIEGADRRAKPGRVGAAPRKVERALAPVLGDGLRKINGTRVHPRRRVRLQPPKGKPQAPEAGRQPDRRRLSGAPARFCALSAEQAPVQKGPRRQHYGTGREGPTVRQAHTRNTVAIGQ